MQSQTASISVNDAPPVVLPDLGSENWMRITSFLSHFEWVTSKLVCGAYRCSRFLGQQTVEGHDSPWKPEQVYCTMSRAVLGCAGYRRVRYQYPQTRYRSHDESQEHLSSILLLFRRRETRQLAKHHSTRNTQANHEPQPSPLYQHHQCLHSSSAADVSQSLLPQHWRMCQPDRRMCGFHRQVRQEL